MYFRRPSEHLEEVRYANVTASPKLEVLTPQNCQLIFIDQQPQMAFGVQSIDRQVLKNNVVALAKAAKVFKIPTIITTGKNKVVVSGLWTEVCNNSFSLCAILEGGYEIYMVADASGGTSKEAHDYAMQRMIQVGVIPVTWQQVMLEWQRDWARNLRSLWYGRGLRLHDGAQVAAAHINKDARGASPCRRVTHCSRGSPYIPALPRRAGKSALGQRLAMSCTCANTCNIHGHAHAAAWSSRLPIADLKSFWGVLGCACWAV